MDRPRVLVVDDDADVGEFMRDALSSWNYDVTHVASGREGRRPDQPPDLRRRAGRHLDARDGRTSSSRRDEASRPGARGRDDDRQPDGRDRRPGVEVGSLRLPHQAPQPGRAPAPHAAGSGEALPEPRGALAQKPPGRAPGREGSGGQLGGDDAGSRGHRQSVGLRLAGADRGRAAPARNWWPRPSTGSPGGPRARSFRSTAARSRPTCWSRSSSATCEGPSQVPSPTRSGSSARPMAARSSWTRSPSSRRPSRPSCSGSCRRRRSGPSARRRRTRSASG